MCIGTEKATRSAHPTRFASHGSTVVSSARTSWPRVRSSAAGLGEVPGLVTQLIRRNEEDAHALRVVMRSRAPSVVATLPLVFDARARGVRGGAAQDRAAPHQGGIAPGGRVLARRHGVGGRGSLPAHGVPAAPGNGGVWARHLSLAPRTVRPRERVHARPFRRRRPRLRRRDRRGRRRRLARDPAATRWSTSAVVWRKGSRTASRS